MKETIDININGMHFILDKDAFATLQTYLNHMKKHFHLAEGSEEIMADIEARIAELFSELLVGSKQVISLEDVQKIIGQMGQPEDFEDPYNATGHNEGENFEESHSTKQRVRRIYRDADQKVVAGVCSGIGHYFGFDPLWLRIAFALFFFFGLGGSLLLYILLWIALPKAITRAEKLEMKGEPVTFQNISKAVEEEFEELKKKVNSIDNKEFASDAESKFRNFLNEFIGFLRGLLPYFSRVFGGVFGFFLVIIALGFLFPLLALGFSDWGILGFYDQPLRQPFLEFWNYSFLNSNAGKWWLVGIMLLLGIPFLAMLITGVRLLFKWSFSVKWIFLSLILIWILSIFGLAFSCLKVAEAFGESQEWVIENCSNTTKDDLLHLQSTSNKVSEKFNKVHKKHRKNWPEMVKWSKTNAMQTVSFSPSFTITEAMGDSVCVELIYSARGRDKTSLEEHLNWIDYQFNWDGKNINFNNYFTIKDFNYRFQDLEITLYLPEGQRVWLDETMQSLMGNLRDFNGDKLSKNYGEFTMTRNGLVPK